jgi:hypothetical protein
MLKRLAFVLVGLGLVGLLVFQLVSEGAVECRLCVTFAGQRQCATARGPNEKAARGEAQNTACTRMSLDREGSTVCPNVPPEELRCKPR